MRLRDCRTGQAILENIRLNYQGFEAIIERPIHPAIQGHPVINARFETAVENNIL